MRRPPALLLAAPTELGHAFDDAAVQNLAGQLDFVHAPLAPSQWREAGAALERVEVLVGGWGLPVLSAAHLARMPRLRTVFYAAGSIRAFMTTAAWERGVRVSSAAAINAIPVAEFAFAQIVLALKRAWPQAACLRTTRRFTRDPLRVPGAYRSTVGLVSLGAIGRRVAGWLQRLEVTVLAYDPYAMPADATSLGVKLVDLSQLFTQANVVSCHAPALPKTRGLITRQHLGRLPRGASFINTARGSIVDEAGLLEVLMQRPDLTAMLDVTDPDPPAEDSPLYTLPNIFLTPHLAGSLDGECERMGHFIIKEVARYVTGQPLQGEILPQHALHLA